MFSFLKTKKTNISRGEGYYIRENLVNKQDDLSQIFKLESKLNYLTNQSIKYNGFELNNIEEKKILSSLGKPEFIINKFPSLKAYKVIFYRKTSGRFSVLSQFHFYKDNFLFVEKSFRSNKVISDSDKQLFVEIITDENFPEIKLDFNKGFNFRITDKNNNYLSIKDGINFRMTFLNNSDKNNEIIMNSDFSV